MNNRNTLTEDFSLPSLRAGDRAEFARLVEAYSGFIHRLALKLLEDPQDALVLDVCIPIKEMLERIFEKHPPLREQK